MIKRDGKQIVVVLFEEVVVAENDTRHRLVSLAEYNGGLDAFGWQRAVCVHVMLQLFCGTYSSDYYA